MNAHKSLNFMWLPVGLLALLSFSFTGSVFSSDGLLTCNYIVNEGILTDEECQDHDKKETKLAEQKAVEIESEVVEQQPIIAEALSEEAQQTTTTSNMKITVIAVRYVNYPQDDQFSVRARVTDSNSIDENPFGWSKSFANCPAEAGFTDTEARFRMSELLTHKTCMVTFENELGETFGIVLNDDYERGYGKVFHKE